MTDRDRTAHDSPDLVGLLAGELGRNETIEAAHHLEGCDLCAHELADLAVAHAALQSSGRVTTQLDTARMPPTSTPGDGGDVGDVDDPLPRLVLPLGDPAAGPPAGPPGRPSDPRPRPGRWRVLTIAAAAVLVIGTGTAVGLAATHSRSTPVPVATAALQPIAAPPGSSGAVAVYAEGQTRSLVVDIHHLPDPGPQSFYEVWLLDPATRKMLSMGVLSPSGHGRFDVSAGIMDGYSAVDVSLQANDGDPAHSRTSVLRAYL